MRSVRPFIVGMSIALLFATGGALAAVSFSGTWSGPGVIIKAIPICKGPAAGQVGCQSSGDRALFSFRLKFDAKGIDYYAVGPTGASHDSPSAKASCTMRFTFDRLGGGWTYYRQAARGKVSAGAVGGVTIPCETMSLKIDAILARVRKAGAKLKVEFGSTAHPGEFEVYTYLTRA